MPGMWAECGTIFKKWASVGLAAHGFYMPLPIWDCSIIGYPCPCFGGIANHDTHITHLWGAVSNTDPIHKGMKQIHNPDTKTCQH